MKNSTPNYQRNTTRSIWKLMLIVALIGTTAFIPLKILDYGITSPTPVGTYLNNAFPDEAPSSTSSWTTEVAFPNLTFTDPIQLLEIPGTNKFLMAGKKGRLWSFDRNPNTSTKTTLLNIESKILTSGDAGLMGVALHPEFGQVGSPNRGYLYVWSRQRGPTSSGNLGYVVLSRYNWPAGSNVIDANSEFVMIKQYDRHQWHNGGGMFFGLDGFLYISSGDEGGANDQYNTGQKINVGLLAGALRIDVDRDASRSHPIRRQPLNPANPPSGWPASFSQGYFVPNDNPWQSPNGSTLEEFYAIGFRSPHRMTQDPQTGDIWMGDIGQGRREEVGLVPKGSNLQWPYKEGSFNGPKAKPSNLIGFDQPPVFDYGRSEGTCVIGGFVYRGNKWPSLRGKYLFGDHTNRNVWSLDYDNVSGNATRNYLATVPAFGQGSKAGISSFATDADGEIYILKLFGTNLDGGKIYKLNATNLTPDPPQFLSQTGAFSNLNTLSPAPGLIPYTVNAPLWSDNAAKKRWISVPNNGTYNTAAEDIVFNANDEWQFPEGTVFIKHFEMPLNENNPSIVKRLETRFMVRDKNGGLYGVTYKWNAAGTDAELLAGADTEPYTITQANGSTVNRVWEFPSRSDCMTCHNENSGGVLGVNTHQLNGDFLYPSGEIDNQLKTWNHIGIFNVNLNEANIPNYLASAPLDDPTASLETKVRSYLDANCAHCHTPNGVNASFDTRFTTPLSQQNLIDGELVGSYGIPGAVVVKRGDKDKSILYVRDNSVGTDAMPPLAKSVIDEDYIQVLEDWINSLDPNQTITFPAIADKFSNDPPFSLNATASSGLPVSYSVLSGPASVSGNTVTLSGQEGTVRIRASQAGNGDYNAAPSITRTFAVIDPPAGGDCFIASNGQVVIEAENYTEAIAGTGNASGSTWQNYSDNGASGGTALRAEPNTGVWTGLNLNGPRLDYDINFAAAGSYYVFVRTSAPSGSDDSFHAGLNGNSVTNQSGIGMGANGPWTWAEDANSGTPVIINVPSAGKHTFNLWMREDGTQIDKIVIKTATGGPTGQGPAESNTGDCGGGTSNQAPIASFSATPSSGTVPLPVSFNASASSDNEGPIASYVWDFGDGSSGSGVNPSHTYTQAGLYTATLTVTDQGGLTDNETTNIQVNNSGNGDDCFTEVGGEVVIEAENFSLAAAGTGNATASNWISYNDGNASNGTALRAVPNVGVWTGLNTNGPRLDYDINFNSPGVYRVYIRTNGPSGNDDSYHIGLNGNSVSSNSGFGMGINGPWAWADYANDDNFVEINVPSSGKHTFNVWMREDGVQIDKIVISKNGSPGGLGPVESGTVACGGSANQAPLASFTASPSSGFAPLSVATDASASSDPEGPITNYSWNFGDGTTASGVTANHVYTTIGTYTLSLVVTDNEGLTSQSSRIITVSPQGNGPQCFVEANGIVVMEAENYSSIVPGTGNASGSSWTSFVNANATNSEAMRATPNTGVYTGLSINGPRLDYDITFSTAGTYRIYVRTNGPGGTDDSYHVGLNGVSASSTNGYGMGHTGSWFWADYANEDDFVEVVVPSTGQHTFNIWMREDGVEVDKIVLKVAPGTPSGAGPAESSQADCASPSQIQTFAVNEQGGNANLNWGNFFEEFKDSYVLERSFDGISYEILDAGEIIVDERFSDFTDVNVQTYDTDKIFYRLKIKDSFGNVRDTREGVLTLRTAKDLFSIHAYPNPATDKLSLAYTNSKGLPLTLKVLNAIGQTVHVEELIDPGANGRLRLDLGSWSEGVYFIQLTDGQSISVQRVLVE